ncbi:hypothetical protein HYT57_03725 [Candidatus Woesearchaeota archaeon]|nr:hypothetical protein [Candidatus Woesearchaeota archaeon]
MKKALSTFVIAIFLFSFIPVNAQTSTNSCCLKNNNGEYCSYTKSENCDLTNFDVSDKIGIKKSDFACSQLEVCKPVCCINKEGTCSEKVTAAQCIDQGGVATSQTECSAVPQCQKGACVINGQCEYPVTQEECTRARDNFDTETTFDIEVTSINECAEKHSLQEGCCVTTPSCGRKTSKECVDVSGEFKAGMLCSHPDLAGVCPGVKKETSKQCENEDVYWFDSRGNKENVVGVNYDGFIHDTERDKTNKIGNCDFRSGTICGQDNNGENACIDVNCNAGDNFVSNGWVQYKFDDGTGHPERITITQEDLGGRDARYNGESWCMTNTKSNPNTPGTIHYVYSCQLGKIEVSPLGTFRNTICESQTKDVQIEGKTVAFESAGKAENKWENCRQCGKGWGNKCDDTECYKLGGSRDAEKSYCRYSTDGLDECLPKYPPGFDFTGGFEFDKVPSSKYSFESTCGVCGAGGTNSCDRKECTALGDCGNFKEGLNWYEGAFIGGVVAVTAYGGIQAGGPVDLIKEVFTLGKYTAPIKLGSKITIEKIGTFAAKQVASATITSTTLNGMNKLGESDGSAIYQDKGDESKLYMTGKNEKKEDVIFEATKE